MASRKGKFPFKGTLRELALKLNVNYTYLSEVLSGSEQPGGKLAFAIEEATKGKIKAKDLITRKSRRSDPAA